MVSGSPHSQRQCIHHIEDEHEVAARITPVTQYDSYMTLPNPFESEMPEDALEAYLRVCQEIYLDMQREGRWLWPDSQNPDDLLESKDP